jgi:hypothetical protein
MKKLFIVLFLLVFVAGTTQAQKMGIGIQGGVTLPMGDWSDVVSTGFGGKASFLYNLNKKLAISGEFGYFSFGQKEDVYGDFSWSMMPILAGVRYYFTPKGFRAYVMGKLGVYVANASYEVDFGPFLGGKQTYDDSDSEFGFALGGGFLYPIGKTLNLDVNVGYNIVSDANYLGINAGVLIGLGK